MSAPNRDDAKDVAFLHDEKVLAVDLDLGAGPLPEEDAVAGLDVEGDEFSVGEPAEEKSHLMREADVSRQARANRAESKERKKDFSSSG